MRISPRASTAQVTPFSRRSGHRGAGVSGERTVSAT
ncbi:hypothetical protein SVIOM74S_08677 [Streptomyces violarus]